MQQSGSSKRADIEPEGKPREKYIPVEVEQANEFV